MSTTQVKNFGIHRSGRSTATAYDREVYGCRATRAAVMLTFGNEIEILENNQVVNEESNCYVDVFLNTDQAEKLHAVLGVVLARNSELVRRAKESIA